jgi:hypothetical protein
MFAHSKTNYDIIYPQVTKANYYENNFNWHRLRRFSIWGNF